MFANLDQEFLSWGWLIPAFFPVLEAVGRGPLNTCLALYLAWGLTVLAKRGLGGERRTVILFLILISVFGLSLIGAEDLSRGGRTWLKYSFVVLTYFMTLHALALDTNGWIRQFKCLALAGILTSMVLVLRGGITSDWKHLVPVRGLFERNLPFLLPFLLFSLRSIPNQMTRRFSSLGACTVFALIIVFSGGRSALVGFVVALAVYGVIGIGLRMRTVSVICVLIVLSAAVLGGPKGVQMTRGLSTMDLDSISTGRTYLWRHAIAYPPENLLFGVGMDNTRHYENVVHIRNVKGMPDQKVKHLHNFIFDLWYETGFAGLLAYVLFVASLIVPVLRNWKRYSPEVKSSLAPVLSATFAILASASLSFSFHSLQMSVYMFFLLASLTSVNFTSMNDPGVVDG